MQLNNLCVGTSGVAVTNANSIGVDQFTSAALSGAGNTLNYSNAHTHAGLGASINAAIGATAGAAYTTWSFTAVSTLYTRDYRYFAALPSTSTRLLALVDAAGASLRAGVYLDAAGKIVAVNSASSTVATSTLTIPTAQWFRLETDVVGNVSTGSIVVRIYTSPDSTTPAETLTATAINTGGTIGQAWIGSSDSGTTTSSHWYAQAGVNDTVSPGRAGFIGARHDKPTSGTYNVTLPAGAVLNGWIILLACNSSSTATSDALAGSTLLLAAPSNNMYTRALAKQLTATDITNGFVTLTSTVTSHDLWIGAWDTTIAGFDSSNSFPLGSSFYGTRGGVTQAFVTAPAVTPNGSADYCILISLERTTTPPTTVTSITLGAQDYFNEDTVTTNVSALLGHFTGPASGVPTGSSTITYGGTTSGNAIAFILPTVSVAAPAVTSVRVGGVTTAGFKANIDAINVVAGVRLAVSTSSGMTSPVYNSGSATAVDAQGCATLSITGLTANTDYWWQFELDGFLTGPIGRAHTLPTGSAPGKYSFIATSCGGNNTNAVSFDHARTRTNPTTAIRALFAVHLGDLHYADISTAHPGAESLAFNMTAWRGQFAQVNPAALFREIPTEFTMSDHDFGADQAAGAVGNAVYYYQAWRELGAASQPCVPDTSSDPTISGAQGIYRTWTIGKVCYILTDGRGYMSAIAATDNSSKTKLGTTQKAWLKATALGAVQAGKVVVWLHEDGWQNLNTFVGDDTWRAYSTERQELATYFTTNGIATRLLYIHGDWHALAADNGSHNTWGGFPMVLAAPWNQTTGFTGTQSGWSQGFNPNPTGASAQQYGWFDVDDQPGSVTIAFTGYDATSGTDVAAITMTVVFDLSVSVASTITASGSVSGRTDRAAALAGQITAQAAVAPTQVYAASVVGQITALGAVAPRQTFAASTVGQVVALGTLSARTDRAGSIVGQITALGSASAQATRDITITTGPQAQRWASGPSARRYASGPAAT